jgi:mycofactocin precursor
MAEQAAGLAEKAALAEQAQADETQALSSDELLVEEVSIDGMCGVY